MDFKETIKANIRAALEKMGVKDVTDFELEIPPDDKMGDLAFPCFWLSKVLKKSPNEIAKEIARILNCNMKEKGEGKGGGGGEVREPRFQEPRFQEPRLEGGLHKVRSSGHPRFQEPRLARFSKHLRFQGSRFQKSCLESELPQARLSEKSCFLEIIERVEAHGPYVNFFYKRDIFLAEVLKEVLEAGSNYGRPHPSSLLVKDRGQNPPQSPFNKGGSNKVMIEYSSPNTNKPLHLGHGRNNFLGMAVSNLLENAGAEVIRTCIINDRGIHTSKSMVAYQEYGKGDTPKKSELKGDHFVGKYYVMYNEKLKEHPELEEKAKECLRKWEAGEDKTIKLWEKMNKWFYEGVNETYKKIGSRFDKNAVYHESETYKHGREIVMDALKKGIAKKKDDGAVYIDLTEDGLDEKILLRADGTSVYIVQDLYVAVKRFYDFKLDKLIYVVGNEQDYHFQVLFKILKKLGYSFADQLYHLSYGMVELPSGKLKSREGTKVDLDDLVESLKKMAIDAIKEKHGNLTPTLSSKERELRPHPDPLLVKERGLEERAMRIGLAALKFMLLKVSPNKNVMFNPEEAISFEGDTGPYILYAYTRIKSIFKKMTLEVRNWKLEIRNWENVVSDEEMRLAKLIQNFPEILKKAADDLNPAILANYLLELSGAFNQFYHIHKVIDAETEELREMRLALIQAAAIVIERGMGILGIEMVEEM
ncbi:MAG: arginine--tRNA ligase [bacterium]